MENNSGIVAKWQSWSPYFLSALRIVAAFGFMQHGLTKLFAFPKGMGPDNATVQLMSQAGLAGILEAVGGGMLLLGVFTRPVAFLVSGEMAVTYFQMHAPRGFWFSMNGGETAVLFCFVWLFISAAGPGPISIDAKLKN